MTIQEFQRKIEAIYLAKDRDRGIPANVAWLVEELGELTLKGMHRVVFVYNVLGLKNGSTAG